MTTESSPTPRNEFGPQHLAEHRDRFLRGIGGPAATSRVIAAQVLLERVKGRKEPRSLLDFGCGPGFSFETFRDLGWFDRSTGFLDYVGFDASMDMVEEAAKRYAGQELEGYRLRFIGAGPMLDMYPETPGSCSATHGLCRHVLEHVEEPATVIARLCAWVDETLVVVWSVPPGRGRTRPQLNDAYLGARRWIHPEDRVLGLFRGNGFELSGRLWVARETRELIWILDRAGSHPVRPASADSAGAVAGS